MADKWDNDPDEQVTGSTDEQLRGVATDDQDFDDADELDEDEIEDEEGGSTF